jgi:DnaJ-class molecular chaperone
MAIDPYAALGLSRTATADEIKKAYRKIARTSHPDLNPDDPAAEAKFKAASAAYDLLKDSETRARFDRGEIDASGAERQQQRTYYRDYAEQPANPYRRDQSYEDFDPSDIFAEMLRGRGRGRTGQGQGNAGFSARGMDTHYSLTVPFLDAAKGATTRITLADGSSVDVKIPEGAEEGTTLRLRGKGEPGYGDGPPGDALITLGIQPHPVFRRDGDDILVTLPITLAEAVLGGKVETPTIGGPVNLTVPKGASSGQTLRLRGRGIRGKGDQKVELKIVMPAKIDQPLADFMEAWKGSNAYDPRKGMMP